MDRGPVLRVRRALIEARVATEDMTADELDERASYLLGAISSIDGALRPALSGPSDDLSTGDLFRRLGALADAANPRTTGGTN